MYDHATVVPRAELRGGLHVGVVVLVVVTRRDEDPIAGVRGVDRRLDGGVLAGRTVEGPDEQDRRPARSRGAPRENESREKGRARARPSSRPDAFGVP